VRVDHLVALVLELRARKIVRAHAHADTDQAGATIGSGEWRQHGSAAWVDKRHDRPDCRSPPKAALSLSARLLPQ
jgi:hypothetical protein